MNPNRFYTLKQIKEALEEVANQDDTYLSKPKRQKLFIALTSSLQSIPNEEVYIIYEGKEKP